MFLLKTFGLLKDSITPNNPHISEWICLQKREKGMPKFVLISKFPALSMAYQFQWTLNVIKTSQWVPVLVAASSIINRRTMMFGNTVDQRKRSLVTLHSYIQFHSSRGHETKHTLPQRCYGIVMPTQPAFTSRETRIRNSVITFGLCFPLRKN